MLVGTFNKFVRVRARHGFRLTQKEVTIAASQSIKKYDFLGKTSGANTFEQACALDASNNTGTTSSGNQVFFGIAAAPIVTGADGAEATTGRTTIPVWVLDTNIEVALRIYHATPGSAEPRDLTYGTPYLIQRWRGSSASEWWYSALTTTTNGEFAFVERHAGSADDDDHGVCWFRPIISETVQLG
jgi:hypothetical protein